MTLKKRLKQIENRLNPEQIPTMKTATVNVDGTCVLRYDDTKIEFDNAEQMEAYINKNGFNRKHILDIQYVNARNEH